MEPRPPRGRSPRPFDATGTPPAPGIGDRLYPGASEPMAYPTGTEYAPGMAAEPPLLPRQQRRQRKALRGLGITVLVIGLLAAAGWFFRDTIQGFIAPTPPAPTVVAQTTDDPGDVAAPALASPAAGVLEPEIDEGGESTGLPNALATVTPTAAPATATAPPDVAAAPEVETGEAALDSEPDRDISAQTLPLLDLLPTLEQVPAGLVLADEAERSKAEVVDQLGGSDEAAQLLEDWGWSGNAFQEYNAAADAVAAGGTTYLNISVHRFADAESAANALVFFSDYVIIQQGLQEVEAPAVGENARLLFGAPDGVALAVLYSQEGPIMYRIGGSTNAVDSDPSAEVLAVAAAIIPGQANGDGG